MITQPPPRPCNRSYRGGQVNGQECGPVPLLVAYHKPRGVITTLKDDWDRKDLSTVLPKSLLRK